MRTVDIDFNPASAYRRRLFAIPACGDDRAMNRPRFLATLACPFHLATYLAGVAVSLFEFRVYCITAEKGVTGFNEVTVC